jgi:hypothetical protein
MMSSKDIVFAPGEGLEPSMNAEIVVGRPSFLDDCPLQLVLQVTITGTQDSEAEACILSYHFRTDGPAQAETSCATDLAGQRTAMLLPEN